VPAGHIPSIDEAKARLEHLERHGPTAVAFTFRQRFPAPGDPAIPAAAAASGAATLPATTR
jgi:Domain of unknown function (DUF3291)